MRVSLNVAVGARAHDGIVAEVRDVGAHGLAGAWWPQLPPVEGMTPWDPLTSIAASASAAPGIELGTAVLVAGLSHPLALASAALTTHAVTGGRLTLGLGTSHAPLVAGVYGEPVDRPLGRLAEFLDVLLPALDGRVVDADARVGRFSAHGVVDIPVAHGPSVLLAALGPRMLELAGRRTDGTIVTWSGPRTLENHVVPRITRAAQAEGRLAPKVVTNAIVVVTDDADGLRAESQERFGLAAQLPSYARMFELEGVSGPGDAIVAGSEREVEAALRRLLDAGATEILATPLGSDDERQRTLDLLGALATSDH